MKYLVAAAMLATVAMQAGAQKPKQANKKCGVDSSAQWFAKQRAWLDEPTHAWSDDTLRASLLRATGLEPVNALPVQMGWEAQSDAGTPTVTSTESAVVSQLLKLAATRGATWPTKSVAGAKGTRAVWLLAHRDTALARAALKRMMEAGPEESNAADVATLEDRLRLISGRKQLYGTQFRIDADGKVTLAPMEDSAHADLRREGAGLPPFKVSACLARVGAK
jgi:hypothetical protein